jgi:hypothetical protein
MHLHWLANEKVRGANPSEYDPNDPNWLDPNNLWQTPGYMDEHNGFWIALQFISDGVAGDPNGKQLKCTCWNGEKFDWDATWIVSKDLGTVDPDLDWWPEWYWTDGLTGLGAYGDSGEGIPADVVFDNVEARIGLFTNVSHTLSLKVKNADYGTVTIDPDLLDDPNNASGDPNVPTDPNELRRYTDGTEITMVAEAIEGRAFKKWKIWDDPNHYPDPNDVIGDTNTVLYLTMGNDYRIEAVFSCASSSVLPPVAIALLMMVLGVLIRRLTCSGEPVSC